MIAPDKAASLLDELVYERVMSCIDLGELSRFANELMVALDDVGVEEVEVTAIAKDMVMRALTRIRDEVDQHGPLGESAAPLDDDCPLCIDLARHEHEEAAARQRKAAKVRTS